VWGAVSDPVLTPLCDADLLTGADLNADQQDDLDLEGDSAAEDDVSDLADADAADGHGDDHRDANLDMMDDASGDVATAKGMHKREEDRNLLPTEDK